MSGVGSILSVWALNDRATARPAPSGTRLPLLDPWVLALVLALIGLGLVMVASASITRAAQMGTPLYFLQRQAVFAGVGLLLAVAVIRLPVGLWWRWHRLWLVGALGLLVLVLLIGREVNGAVRWIPLGPVNFQVVEAARLGLFLFLAASVAGWRLKARAAGRSDHLAFRAMLPPALAFLAAAVLLLAQPDFGSVAVLGATLLLVLFLSRAHLVWLILALAAGVALFLLLIVVEPYRMQRLIGFQDPWSDPYGSGFQLVQSLIAIGAGGFGGTGLGGSVQKLFYLPEAHTDFIFAVLAEELGLIGVLLVLTLFGLLIGRLFWRAWQAERAGNLFGATFAYAIAVWLALQAGLNIAVNMGLVPTKGLPMPLISYGGSSLIGTLLALALVLRLTASHSGADAADAVARREGSG